MFGLNKGAIRAPRQVDVWQVGAAALLASWKLITTYSEWKANSQKAEDNATP